MAKIPLIPIGSARASFLDAASFEKNRAAMLDFGSLTACSTPLVRQRQRAYSA